MCVCMYVCMYIYICMFVLCMYGYMYIYENYTVDILHSSIDILQLHVIIGT